MRKVITIAPPDTGDPWCDLLAMIVRRAIDDAMKGSAEAQQWLDSFWPEWGKWVSDERMD